MVNMLVRMNEKQKKLTRVIEDPRDNKDKIITPGFYTENL